MMACTTIEATAGESATGIKANTFDCGVINNSVGCCAQNAANGCAWIFNACTQTNQPC